MLMPRIGLDKRSHILAALENKKVDNGCFLGIIEQILALVAFILK